MKNLIYISILFIIYSCSETPHELSQKEIELSKLYDVVCEKWIEQNFPCQTDSCFSSAAIEIVGIDTQDVDLYKIYAWFWNEHFISKNSKIYSGNKKLSIARFSIQPSTVAKKIDEVYIPIDTISLKEQLSKEQFPQKMVETYFLQQHNNVEQLRILALSNKSKKKFELYLKNSYQTPEFLEKESE